LATRLIGTEKAVMGFIENKIEEFGTLATVCPDAATPEIALTC